MKRLLVANRGEIARRIFRTARHMGISTVAVFSDPDEDAPHVHEADLSVRLAGSTPAETYLDIDKILAAAAATGADAVHPGYGFLSENATFARACAEVGLVFVGPSPEAIDAMGSKIAAKELMAAAGVPILGSEGYPLLVKAAFGGGGRGMRIVHDEAGLADALASAEREATAAFGDGTVFVERYVENPRHVEVQIFGDTHGNVIHLFERECSIQRRYQKIIEEAPSPAVDAALRDELCAAAIAAGKAIDYVGAGTVEFVLAPTGEFFFLEVNTRLQVEHPVTELVTGLDLVELQLRVARGERLDVEPELRGHAVEARLYAEDVAAGFVPASGRIERMTIPVAEGVRVDAGYEDGSTVSTFYDAMLAKVVAHGDTRRHAIDRLTEALEASRVHGVPTNRELLVGVLRHPEFLSGATDTGFLARHDPSALATSALDPSTFQPLHAVAAALAAQADRRTAATVQATIPSGWRNVPTTPQLVSFTSSIGPIDIGYEFARHGLVVTVNGAALDDVRLWHAEPTSVELTVGGVRRHYDVHRAGATVYVDSLGASSTLVEIDRLPTPERVLTEGSMLAPLPGAVIKVMVATGDRVIAGQPLVVIEAMKMEHSVNSAHDGTVETVLTTVGQQVETGAVLVVVDRDGEPGGEQGSHD